MNLVIGCGIIISLFCNSHAMNNDCVWVKTTNKEISKIDIIDAKNSLLITLVTQKSKKSISDDDRGTLRNPITIPIGKPELQLLKKSELSKQPIKQARELLKKWKPEDYYTLVETTEKLKSPVFYTALIQALLLPEISTKIAQMYLSFASFRMQFLQKNLKCCILDISNRTPSRRLLMEYANIASTNTISSSNSLPLLPLTSHHKKNQTTILQIPNKNFKLKAGKFYIKLLRLNGTEFADQTEERKHHQRFAQTHGHITCIALHPHGLCFAAGYEKGLISLWMLPRHDISIRGTQFLIPGKSMSTSNTAISHLEFNENSMLLSQSDRTILWDIELWHTDDINIIDMGAQAKSLLYTDGSYAITISQEKNIHNSEFSPLIKDMRTITKWDLHKKKIDVAYGQLTLYEALQLKALTYTH